MAVTFETFYGEKNVWIVNPNKCIGRPSSERMETSSKLLRRAASFCSTLCTVKRPTLCFVSTDCKQRRQVTHWEAITHYLGSSRSKRSVKRDRFLVRITARVRLHIRPSLLKMWRKFWRMRKQCFSLRPRTRAWERG